MTARKNPRIVEDMRFLSFNLWHGLSPASLVAFESLEPVARRRLREELQENLLAHVDADFAFFQECNPIAVREKRLRERLDRVSVSQPDLVGLKLFGFGFPLNLHSGLLMLAKPQHGLRWVESVSLSRPGTRLVRSWGSWQLKEERFAVFAETLVPGWGRVLCVNTHLHHGLEVTEKFMSDLQDLGQQLELSDSLMTELKQRLLRGNARRMQELGVLMKHIEQIKRRYNAVVLCGDLNCSPESEVHASLTAYGFRDAWAEGAAGGEIAGGAGSTGHTFDHTLNEANHLLQARFPLTLVLEDLTFDVKVKDALLKLARAQENKPRRIDYIWFWSDQLNLRVRHTELIGLPNAEGLAPSDHFGVVADIELVT